MKNSEKGTRCLRLVYAGLYENWFVDERSRRWWHVVNGNGDECVRSKNLFITKFVVTINLFCVVSQRGVINLSIIKTNVFRKVYYLCESLVGPCGWYM